MSNTESARVVLVGHCRPDQFMLRSAIESMQPGAEIVIVNDMASLGAADAASVYLVNRVLDGSFDSTDGIALVESLANAGGRAMLITNLADSMADSVSRGGLPGFGKSELRSDRMRAALEGALAAG